MKHASRTICLKICSLFIYLCFFSLQLSAFAASKARDTIAKEIYSHLFEIIVLCINRAFNCDYQGPNIVNILDLAGFGMSIYCSFIIKLQS